MSELLNKNLESLPDEALKGVNGGVSVTHLLEGCGECIDLQTSSGESKHYSLYSFGNQDLSVGGIGDIWKKVIGN